MRLETLHVDGFGALCDFKVEEISDGLVVFLGPNEAGKSTLLDFVSGVLFGFPRRDNPRHRAPVRGGRHGGSLVLADGGRRGAAEQLWRVERYAGSHGGLAVRCPDGSEGSADDLRAVLGGADEALFRAVFAVDLSELGSAAAMTSSEVRELLFSASIVGQRRSASRAIDTLKRRRLELARARQPDAPANRLWAQLEAVRGQLADAAREAGGYLARSRELAAIEEAIGAERLEADGIEERVRELDLLGRLFESAERTRKAEEALTGAATMTPADGWLLAQAPELRSLNAACSGHLERARQLDELRTQREGIEQSIRAGLTLLGPGWERDRVCGFDGWIALKDEVRGFRESLDESDARWRAATLGVERADSDPDLVLEARPAEAAPSPDGAEKKAKLLGELRRNIAEQRRLSAEARAAARTDHGGPGADAWLSAVAVLLVGLGVLGAALTARPVPRAVCVLVAVAGAVLLGALSYRRRRRLPGGESGGEAEPSTLEHVTGRIAELAGTLGLGRVPSDSDIETLAERIEAMRDAERSDLDARARLASARDRQAAARDELVAATAELATVRSAFDDWKRAHGLDPRLSPDGVNETLETLQRTWNHYAALQRVDAALDRLGTELGGFELRVLELSRAYGEAGGYLDAQPGELPVVLDELCTRLEAALELDDALRALDRLRAEGASELARGLGHGEKADRLAAELAGGDVLGWQEERECLERRRIEMRESSEKLVRSHQDLSGELRRLESSGTIAELEQRRAQLEHELEEVLSSWALVGTAQLLLQRTLRRHEQERQPAVLARAAERFFKVTEGRYISLLPGLSDDSGRESLRVVSSSGSELDVAALSRGSIEQLYLCLRIALAETFAERATALPIVLDDVLVNFDPARAAAIAEVLIEVAEKHQVLFFTCHPHLSRLMTELAPKSQFVALSQL